ncbi:hypothetical protein ACA910_013494 [Epithemia clementina (nom. ined.)]
MFAVTAASSASRRALTRQVIAQCQKRGMGLGGSKGPAPKWEGLDKVVRTYLPEDHQVCMGVFGLYFGLYVVYKISTIGKKKKVEEPAPAAAPATLTGGIPDIDSPEFEKFLDSEAFVKLLDNEEQLKSLLG